MLKISTLLSATVGVRSVVLLSCNIVAATSTTNERDAVLDSDVIICSTASLLASDDIILYPFTGTTQAAPLSGAAVVVMMDRLRMDGQLATPVASYATDRIGYTFFLCRTFTFATVADGGAS